MRSRTIFPIFLAMLLVMTGHGALSPTNVNAQQEPAPGTLQASIVEEISMAPVMEFAWTMTGTTWSYSATGYLGSLSLINIPPGDYLLEIQPAPYTVAATTHSLVIESGTATTATVVIDMGPDELQVAPWLDLVVAEPNGDGEGDYSYFVLNQSTGATMTGSADWGTTRFENVVKGSYLILINVDESLYIEPDPIELEIEGGQTYTVPIAIEPIAPDPVVTLNGLVVGDPAEVAVGATAILQFDLRTEFSGITGVEITIVRTGAPAPLATCDIGDLVAGSSGSCTAEFTPDASVAGQAVAFTANVTWNEADEALESAPLTIQVGQTVDPVPTEPAVTLSRDRAEPAASVDFALVGMPASALVALSWQTQFGVVIGLGSIQTDAAGAATDSLQIPAAPGGPGHTISFTSGSVSVSIAFNIAPRISPHETLVRRGDTVLINLRGFARYDAVGIRWKNAAGVFLPVGSAITSGTGSVTNLAIVVPAWAPEGVNTIRVDGAINQQSNKIVVASPAATLDPTSGTVGTTVTFSGTHFASNAVVSIIWTRLSGGTIPLGTVQSDNSGAFAGVLSVPAAPGGPDQQISFDDGTSNVITAFDVVPRVLQIGAPASYGAEVELSLRGFAKKESITISWWNPSTAQWIVVSTGETSNTGSANLTFAAPLFASDGANSVRVDSETFVLEVTDIMVDAPME